MITPFDEPEEGASAAMRARLDHIRMASDRARLDAWFFRRCAAVARDDFNARKARMQAEADAYRASHPIGGVR